MLVGGADVVDCPGPDEAFVTTCSGSDGGDGGGGADNAEEIFDESDLVNEVLEDMRGEERESQKKEQEKKSYPSAAGADYDGTHRQQQKGASFGSGEDGDEGYCEATEGAAAIQQLKQTTTKLIRKYYDPLPRKGKCAIGTVCGFAASRLSLGVANRLFRVAGATWVVSEVMYTSGLCDEAQCVPEEARPWIGILRRTLVKQCMKVRLLARKLWNQDRIREIVQKDELVAGGFAAGAFIGFVV